MKNYINRHSIMKFIFTTTMLFFSIFYQNIILGIVAGMYFVDYLNFMYFIHDSQKQYKQFIIDKEAIKNWMN